MLNVGSTHITQQEPNQINDEFIDEIIVNNGSLDDLKTKVQNVLNKFLSI
jgi:FKBP-type peptidyl-prolyl cis-trans isomerase (trigger factor)